MKRTKQREKYKDYFNDLLNWMTPDTRYSPKKLVMAVDVYSKESTKELETKSRRGGKEEGMRIHVTGFDQKMPVGKQKWGDFLSNGENKKRFDGFFRTILERASSYSEHW